MKSIQGVLRRAVEARLDPFNEVSRVFNELPSSEHQDVLQGGAAAAPKVRTICDLVITSFSGKLASLGIYQKHILTSVRPYLLNTHSEFVGEDSVRLGWNVSF